VVEGLTPEGVSYVAVGCGGMRRRTFLSRSASILGGSACASLVAADAWAGFAPKRVLVLGGTLFLGPAVVDAWSLRQS